MKVKISEDLRELIPNFLRNREEELLLLKNYMFQKRYSEAKDIIHGLKGVLGSYGFNKAYELSVSVEKELKNQEYSLVKKKTEELVEYMENLEIEYVDEEF